MSTNDKPCTHPKVTRKIVSIAKGNPRTQRIELIVAMKADFTNCHLSQSFFAKNDSKRQDGGLVGKHSVRTTDLIRSIPSLHSIPSWDGCSS